MAKQFAYASAGLLSLVVAGLLTLSQVRAEWDPSAPGQIVGDQEGRLYYTANGEAWFAGLSVGWERRPERDLPVPPSEVKFLSQVGLLTKADVAWEYSDGWREVGPFPGGAVSWGPETWARIKSEHR